MEDCIFRVAKEIMAKMGEMTGVRVYVSITDSYGNFIYSNSAFKNHEKFITDFVHTNFKYLQQGDHSIPLSSENIVFFKSADNAMIILYNPKGKIGQLLTFKSMLNKYSNSIEECTLKIESSPLNLAGNTSLSIELPLKELKIPTLSYRENLYKNILPFYTKKISSKEKFSLLESQIMNLCGGTLSLFDIMNQLNIEDYQLFEILYKMLTKNYIDFREHRLIKISCPECKKSTYLFIPNYLLKKNTLRIQLCTNECDHYFLAFIDKKLNIRTKFIEKLLDFKSELDLSNLSMENLISFFRQDLFFNIFHAIFFRIPVVFIGEQEIVEELIKFLKKIFINLEYGEQILSVNRLEFEKKFKKFKDYLIVDLNSYIAIDPYENHEIFDFEFRLFKNILKIEGQNLQILQTNSEFERLILHTDQILKECESFTEISEDNLIKSMNAVYDIKIERYEIPIIIKLADIYYNTDLSKKIKRTVSGKLSGWLDNW